MNQSIHFKFANTDPECPLLRNNESLILSTCAGCPSETYIQETLGVFSQCGIKTFISVKDLNTILLKLLSLLA